MNSDRGEPAATPRVFISYAREDQNAAVRLAEALRNAYGDGQVFSDVDAIDTGANFSDVLRRTIHAADVVIVLMSPAYFSSPWAQAELAEALAEKKSLVPVLIRECYVEGPLAYYNWLKYDPYTAEEDVRRAVDLVRRAR